VTTTQLTNGGASILDDHYDGPRPAPHRGPRPKTTIEKQFCDLGSDAEAFLVGATAIGNRLGSELEILASIPLRLPNHLPAHRIPEELLAIDNVFDVAEREIC